MSRDPDAAGGMTRTEARSAASMAGIYALRMLGLFMILPVFALYADELEGVTPALAGLAIGIYGMTQALLQIPYGLLSDRIGRKPVIMFGLGGIFVEIMKDVVFNLTPVTSGEAGQMLSAIKGASMLEGVRGQKGVNRDLLIEIIQRLSQLLTDLPEIQEMDLNPLMAFGDQVVVVDARISIEK